VRTLGTATLNLLQQDLDAREATIREVVYDARCELPAVDLAEHLVATYFVVARHTRPHEVGREISYHMTSGVRHAPPGTLLAECTGAVVDAAECDAVGHVGIVRVAFPLKMLLTEDGDLYSTDVLHVVAGAGVFALTEHVDVKLVDVAMSEEALRKFPGPAYGAGGVRRWTNFAEDEIAFGTIMKPCTGITPDEAAAIIEQAAANPLFLFVKEDENFLPGVAFAPARERIRRAVAAVRRTAARRQGRGLIYAPHLTSAPHLFGDRVRQAVDAGVTGIMFSEYYAGGAVRTARELTRSLPQPPAIYGHNGGISTRTRHVYREVLDLFARLDGVDFRQTAPLTSAGRAGLLRPFGREWRECERVLSEPLAGHAPVMMARAGGLDQGNIITNLLDVTRGAGVTNYLFLAGSAINSIRNTRGEYDPVLGAEAMRQALDVYETGVFDTVEAATVEALKEHADASGLEALATSLRQRYGR